MKNAKITPAQSVHTSLAVAAVLALTAWPVWASDLSNIKSKGGKKLSQEQIAKMYIGKEINGQTPNGKVRFTVHYKQGGSKITKVRGKTIKRNWTYKGGKWCETLNKGSKRICNPIIYKLGSACYAFKPNGQNVGSWAC